MLKGIPLTTRFIGGFGPRVGANSWPFCCWKFCCWNVAVAFCIYLSKAYGLNPYSKLVIGYHWLEFLNQAHKQSEDTVVWVHNSLGILSTRSTISQGLNISEIGKLIFHSFQNIAQLFGQQKIPPLLKEREVCMLLTRTGPYNI